MFNYFQEAVAIKDTEVMGRMWMDGMEEHADQGTLITCYVIHVGHATWLNLKLLVLQMTQCCWIKIFHMQSYCC